MKFTFKKEYYLKSNIPLDKIVFRLKAVTNKETFLRTDFQSDIPFRGRIDNTGFMIRKTCTEFKFYPVKIKGTFTKSIHETSISITLFPEPIYFAFRIILLTILSALMMILLLSSFVESHFLIALPFYIVLVLLEEYIFRKGYKRGIQVSKEIIYRLLEIDEKVVQK